MTDDLAAFLDAAEARAAAATPDRVEGDESGQTGWGYFNIPDGNAELCAPDGSGYRGTTVAAWFECDDCGGGARLSEEDAEFIAAARSDLPVLVGMVRAVLSLCDTAAIYRPGSWSTVSRHAVRAALLSAIPPTPTAEETR